jgi:hypothetical protein
MRKALVRAATLMLRRMVFLRWNTGAGMGGLEFAEAEFNINMNDLDHRLGQPLYE